MTRPAVRMTGSCLLAVAALGLTACDTGPVGPDGTATLAGMVNGDPATATEFLAEFTAGTPVPVGDITLGGA
jgi:hypothetical protein